MRKFAIDEKKEKVDLGTAKVDVTTKWDAGKLTPGHRVVGSLKITRTFQATDEGHQLVVTVDSDAPGAGAEGRAPEAAVKRPRRRRSRRSTIKASSY